ncbi:TIGR01777 family oxidoreductase [Kiloniella sp. EL199]|uniref:TIGR01777 family oxidoreductase n=1 Tax=Kiloniella sp. EL199 TaxID=2107581 RepID=UPI0013C4B63B|nr:TIGR01777 family oxidoreductase [Kiloniella sp. EL199]
MLLVLSLLVLQGIMGAFDNLWHHEITEALPSKPSARKELMLHSAREFIYAALFLMLGWATWHGIFGIIVIILLVVEVGITLWDFIEEDMTRKLPPLERVLHTVLAMNYGAVLILLLPILWGWSLEASSIKAADYGVLSWVMTLYAIGVFLWGVRDFYAVIKLGPLQTPEHIRNPITTGYVENPKTVLITGATGFVGKSVVREQLLQGKIVLVLTRNRAKAENAFGVNVTIFDQLDDISASTKVDQIINLAGEAVIGLPWTRSRRERIRNSRVKITNALVTLIARLKTKPEVLISASAVGYYGDGGEKLLNETSKGQKIFISEFCQEWEAAALEAEKYGVRVSRLRFGIILGHNGGALPNLARPMRLGLGVIMGQGQQWMPWIHLKDVLGLINFGLRNSTISGVINATAPNTVRHKDFMKELGRTLKRKVIFSIPSFLLKRMLGDMSAIFLQGQNLTPSKAIEMGYEFFYPELSSALANLYEEQENSELKVSLKNR